MGSILRIMSSPSVIQGTEENTPLLESQLNEEESEIVKEISAFLKFGKRDNEQMTKTSSKRKKKNEEKERIHPVMLADIFLRICYPISTCLAKSATVGLVKSLDYAPTVLIYHGTKSIIFSHDAWDSFLKHLHLIECYLTNKVCGRRTNIRPLDCDNVIDIIKHRGELQVRIRNSVQHENKILLTREDFFILNYTSPAITRYLKQLEFGRLNMKEYLIDALETKPERPILSGPVDTSIFNRLPEEVLLNKKLRDLDNFVETAEEAVDETLQEEEEEDEEDKS